MIGWVAALLGRVRPPHPPVEDRILALLGGNPDSSWHVTDLAKDLGVDAIGIAGPLASLLGRGLVDSRLVDWAVTGGEEPKRGYFRRVYFWPASTDPRPPWPPLPPGGTH